MEKGLGEYRNLLDKVSSKFDEIMQRNPQHFSCGSGCHSCCVPGLSVFRIEFENIVNALNTQPELAERVRRLIGGKNFSSDRCAMLDPQGRCSIYEVRPLICRSHGAPIFSKMAGEFETTPVLDVCPLNFSKIEKLNSLSPNDFINIDILNQLLVLLNKQYENGRRFNLIPETLVAAMKSKNRFV